MLYVLSRWLSEGKPDKNKADTKILITQLFKVSFITRNNQFRQGMSDMCLTTCVIVMVADAMDAK